MINARRVLKSIWHTIGICFIVVWKACTNPCSVTVPWSCKSSKYSNTEFLGLQNGNIYLTGFTEIGNVKTINVKCCWTVISRGLTESSSLPFPRRLTTCHSSQGPDRSRKAYQKRSVTVTCGRACWLCKVLGNLIFQLALLLLLKNLQLLKPLDEQNM